MSRFNDDDYFEDYDGSSFAEDNHWFEDRYTRDRHEKKFVVGPGVLNKVFLTVPFGIMNFIVFLWRSWVEEVNHIAVDVKRLWKTIAICAVVAIPIWTAGSLGFGGRGWIFAIATLITAPMIVHVACGIILGMLLMNRE